MRTLMLGMTGFAILCGLGVALPVALSQFVLGLIWIAASGCLLTGIVFARGDERAFCIGAAVVISSMWTGVGARFLEGAGRLLFLVTGGIAVTESIGAWIEHGILALAAIANGYLCIRARRYFERHADD